MRSLLVCHHDAALDRYGLARWLASFSDLVGVVVITETRATKLDRIRRQIKRSGWLRFLDVIAFRLHYKLVSAGADAEWERSELERLKSTYPGIVTETIEAATPDCESVRKFIEERKPDIMIARTKFLLPERIYGIPSMGTFVLHPGICPQYRNAHGCFWALCHRDLENVGLTLLQIDEGIDTGPIYGFYEYPFDEILESHHRIQLRCLFENLDPIAKKLAEIADGRAAPLNREGLPSGTWGQPWLTRYLRWKRDARNRRNLSER